jgi:hypothetical protein
VRLGCIRQPVVAQPRAGHGERNDLLRSATSPAGTPQRPEAADRADLPV